MLYQPTFEQVRRAQASIVTVGLLTVVSVGMVACIGLVFTLFYLVVNFVLLVLQAVVEVVSTISTTWGHADPLLKVLILVAMVYGGYRLYQARAAKKRGVTP